eukprot:2192607-Pleurochrysis_carterae.AAC.1
MACSTEAELTSRSGTRLRTVGQQQVLVEYGSTPQHGTSCPVNSFQHFYLLVMLGLEPSTSRL